MTTNDQPIDALATTIWEFLGDDQPEKAVDILIEFFNRDTPVFKELIIHSATLTRVKRAYSTQLIDWDKMNQNKNRVILSITQIIDQLYTLEARKKSKPTHKPDETYRNHLRNPKDPSHIKSAGRDIHIPSVFMQLADALELIGDQAENPR